MGARPFLVAPLVATVVTGCLLRPTGVHQSDASVDAASHPDSGGGGGGGGIDAGGDAAVDAPTEGGPDAPVEGGMDATGEGGTGADPCAAAAALTADSITCSPNAMKTGAGSATASATEGNEYCVWDGAALTGANPSASVLVTQAPASGTGHAYLDVKLGTQPDLSLYINSNSGTLSPSLGAGWGSGSDPGVGFPSQICIRIREVSGMVIGEYADPVIGWQPFAMANETLDSPVAVTVGVVSSSALTTKATFSELGTGTAP